MGSRIQQPADGGTFRACDVSGGPFGYLLDTVDGDAVFGAEDCLIDEPHVEMENGFVMDGFEELGERILWMVGGCDTELLEEGGAAEACTGASILPVFG